MSFGNYYDDFLKNLDLPVRIPADVEILYPFHNPDVVSIVREFYQTFYSDNNYRTMLVGINPGRFGAGVTGIPFTDPIRLGSVCGISSHLPQRPELSSTFIYEMISNYGSVRSFYQKYIISAVSPIGFVRDGKNLNYYDDAALQDALEPFILDCMKQQIAMGVCTDIAYCLGQGQNYKYLLRFNKKWQLFNRIVPLPHPRWIMQYRLKKKDAFIQQYLQMLA